MAKATVGFPDFVVGEGEITAASWWVMRES
jgi:hypothetical protein